MPELPEVETIARSLRNPINHLISEIESLTSRPGIVGRSVESATLYWSKSLALPSQSDFEQLLAGKQVTGVTRRGKFLVIQFSEFTMLIHLRMSGDIRVELSTEPLQKHDRMVLRFADGWQMVFNDPRKFGRIWLVDDLDDVTGNLGKEPLDDGLTSEWLFQRLQSTSRQIKPLLLDQGILSGLGNIYTDESLFLAGIHPLTPSNELSQQQVSKLLISIRQVLEEGIRRNGASIDWVYRGGDFQNHFKVYQRTGKPCVVCGTPIERIVVGQRGTHFCPKCQPLI
jgi:formamidopyrimidine-DNA glycosylase